jgi:hypothetical protein
MFTELQALMAQALVDGDFDRALEENATGKRTKSNQGKTHKYLRTLYDLDPSQPRFQALMAFWEMAERCAKPLPALTEQVERLRGQVQSHLQRLNHPW